MAMLERFRVEIIAVQVIVERVEPVGNVGRRPRPTGEAAQPVLLLDWLVAAAQPLPHGVAAVAAAVIIVLLFFGAVIDNRIVELGRIVQLGTEGFLLGSFDGVGRISEGQGTSRIVEWVDASGRLLLLEWSAGHGGGKEDKCLCRMSLFAFFRMSEKLRRKMCPKIELERYALDFSNQKAKLDVFDDRNVFVDRRRLRCFPKQKTRHLCTEGNSRDDDDCRCSSHSMLGWSDCGAITVLVICRSPPFSFRTANEEFWPRGRSGLPRRWTFTHNDSVVPKF